MTSLNSSTPEEETGIEELLETLASDEELVEEEAERFDGMDPEDEMIAVLAIEESLEDASLEEEDACVRCGSILDVQLIEDDSTACFSDPILMPLCPECRKSAANAM